MTADVERWRELVDDVGDTLRAQGWRTPFNAQVLAQIEAESHGDPSAQSGAGARGLMQIMPQWLPSDRMAFDPTINLTVGIWLMSDAMRRSKLRGDPPLMRWQHALMEYYTGKLDGWDAHPPGDPELTGAFYVDKISRLVRDYVRLPQIG